MVAQDKHGEPVTGLTSEDFRVFDKGTEQKIAFFSMESQGTLPADVPAPPRDTWTNRFTQGQGAPASVTLILLDGLNTKIQDRAYAHDQVVRFLSQIRPEDRVALYALGTDLQLLHDFTQDASSLLRTLSRYKGYNGPRLPEELGEDTEPDTGNDTLDQFLKNADAAITQNIYVQRAYRTVDALEAIAAHVEPIPGRKNLIWVSGGFPISIGYDGLPMQNPAPGTDDRNFMELVERAARALNDANLAVYPVDAAGLMTPMSGGSRTPFFTPTNPRRPPPPSLGTPRQHIQDTMNAIADRTGGRAYYNTNDLSSAIRNALNDSRVTYTLAYTPTHNEWNGKYREIKVECRRSGVRLRYRAGYFALPDTHLDANARKQMLAEAVWSPLVATEIGLTARMSTGTLDGRAAKVIAMTVDPKDLQFEEEDGRHTTDMLMVTAQSTAGGQIVHAEEHSLAMRLKEETYQSVRQHGLRINVTLVAEPAVTRFRLVLLDAATGKLGSLDLPAAGAAAAADRKKQPAGAANP